MQDPSRCGNRAASDAVCPRLNPFQRPALLRRARPTLESEGLAVTKNERRIFGWLNGANADMDGKWFGDCDCCDHKRPYWWRRHLRKQLDRIKSK